MPLRLALRAAYGLPPRFKRQPPVAIWFVRHRRLTGNFDCVLALARQRNTDLCLTGKAAGSHTMPQIFFVLLWMQLRVTCQHFDPRHDRMAATQRGHDKRGRRRASAFENEVKEARPQGCVTGSPAKFKARQGKARQGKARQGALPCLSSSKGSTPTYPSPRARTMIWALRPFCIQTREFGIPLTWSALKYCMS